MGPLVGSTRRVRFRDQVAMFRSTPHGYNVSVSNLNHHFNDQVGAVQSDARPDALAARAARRATFKLENSKMRHVAKGEQPELLPILVLFSGEKGREQGFEARCAAAGRGCVMIDIIHGGGAHDLLSWSVFQLILRRVQAGEFHGVVIAIPCNTFSVARCADGGPPALRSRAKSTGVGGLAAGHFKQLVDANLLVKRAVVIARAAVNFVFEHPPVIAASYVQGTPPPPKRG